MLQRRGVRPPIRRGNQMAGGKLRVVEAGLIAALLGSSAMVALASSPARAVALRPTLLIAESAPATRAPAIASPYVWSASKFAGGGVSFDGFLPSQDERQSLLDGIDNLIADKTELASGDPDGFAENAAAALDVLDALDTGKVSFDGSAWTISGAVGSADKLTIAKAAFDSSPLAALGATYHVSGPAMAATPVAAAVVTAPDISTAPAMAAATAPDISTITSPNYTWSAERAGDGTITFDGTVPTDKLKRFLLGEAGAAALDNSKVAMGAPKDFVGGALNGLDALLKLHSGKLLFANGSWSLSGIASNNANVAAAHTALVAIDTKSWTFDITVPAETASVTPAATTPPMTPAPTAVAPNATTAPTAAVPLAPIATPKVAEPASTAKGSPPQPAATTPIAAVPATAAPAATTAVVAAPAVPATAAPAAMAPVATAPVVAKPAPMTPPAPAAAIAAGPAPASTAPAPFVFGAVKSEGGAMMLTGDVPSDAIKSYFGDVASDVATDGLKVVANAPPGFVAEALQGLEALSKLGTGELAFDGKSWSLKGRAATLESQSGALHTIAALSDGTLWVTAIAGPPPLDLCRSSLAGFDQLNAISFDGGTRFTKPSAAALDTLAQDLAVCPAARVDVEGNTDADGNADTNMALSVARAEAVVSELIKRGVSVHRLYAVGNGENVPLVPNTSEKNKVLNRRIGIEVEPGDGK
jgi:outer membrane protein OmpA-like peptidoglycan-associated protein